MPCYLLSSEGDFLESSDGDLLISYDGFDFPLTATVASKVMTYSLSQNTFTAVLDQ